MPRPRLTVEQRRISQARRRQLDAARKRRRRMDINYRQNEQQANTEARRKARQVSRTHYRKVNGRRHLQADVMPTIFDYPEYLLSQCSVIRMANNQQTLIGSSQDFFPLADHSIFGECSGASSKQVVDDCSRSLLRSCKLVPKLQTSKKIRKSDDHGAEGVDRVPTVNTDCRNMDSEPPSSLEENESEKKRDVAVEESDTSVCSVDMSAGASEAVLKTESTPHSEADPLSISVEGRERKLPEVPAPVVGRDVQDVIGKLKFEPDSGDEADVMPKNIETEFIDIKAEGTPDSAALETDDNEELHSVISSLHEYGGVDEKCATASKSESCTPGSTLRPASSRDSLVHSPITSSCYHR